MSSSPSLPSGVAYAPPSPPPPGSAPPPPGWPGYRGFAPWFPMPPPPPGERTREAVGLIQKSIQWYIVYVVLELITTLAAAALLGEFIFPSGGPFSSSLASDVPNTSTGLGAAYLAASAILGILGFVAFIILILAWANWRSGSQRLLASAGEYGPGPARAARDASEAWTYTTIIFFVGLIATIALVAIIFVSAFSAAVNSPTGNQTSTITDSIGGTLSELVIAAGIFGVVISLLTYWYATRGLIGGLVAISPPAVASEANAARPIILIGAVLSILGVIGYFVPFGTLLGVISPALILFGFWKLRSAYGAWLADPPRPGSYGIGGGAWRV